MTSARRRAVRFNLINRVYFFFGFAFAFGFGAAFLGAAFFGFAFFTFDFLAAFFFGAAFLATVFFFATLAGILFPFSFARITVRDIFRP
jgi:hypothetical protein